MTGRPASAPRLADSILQRLDFLPVEAVDPADWVQDRLGEALWSKQQEIARSVGRNPRTAVQSAHSTGKSFIGSRLVAWWIDSHPVGEALVWIVAPTSAQISTIVFRELGKAHKAHDLPGRLTGGAVPRWVIGDELVALGRKSQDLTNAEEAASAVQGLHARYVLVVIDEAGGVPPYVYDVAASIASNEHARVLAIGNPTDPASHFAKVCAPGSGWNVIEVSAFDTPSFTGEEVSDELLESLIAPGAVERARQDWGEGSPRWTSRILGQFPAEADDTLISREWIREAHGRVLAPADPGALGCDIARAGGDETVAYWNRGGVVRLAHRAHGHDLMRTTGAIGGLLRSAPGATAIVDAIGLGAGVFDALREQGREVAGFVASERAWRPDRFANRRAEVFWELREAFREGLVDLDSEDEVLSAQLLSIRWHEDSRGRILIESKADARRRGVSSPDRADAVAMSFHAGHWRPARPDAAFGLAPGDQIRALMARVQAGEHVPDLLERITDLQASARARESFDGAFASSGMSDADWLERPL